MKPERLPQSHDGGADASIVFVLSDVADEGTIDLERVQRKTFEVGERRIPRAEVVNGDADGHSLAVTTRSAADRRPGTVPPRRPRRQRSRPRRFHQHNPG